MCFQFFKLFSSSAKSGSKKKAPKKGLKKANVNTRSANTRAKGKGKKNAVVEKEELEQENEPVVEAEEEEPEKTSVMKGKLAEAIEAATAANSRYRTRRAVKIAESTITQIAQQKNVVQPNANRRPKRTVRA
jgi:hypothetical protein